MFCKISSNSQDITWDDVHAYVCKKKTVHRKRFPVILLNFQNRFLRIISGHYFWIFYKLGPKHENREEFLSEIS